MRTFAALLEKIHSGGVPSDRELHAVEAEGIESFQLSALWAQWLLADPAATPRSIHESARAYLASAGLMSGTGTGDQLLARVLERTADRQELGHKDIDTMVGRLCAGRLDHDFLAVWLSLVCSRELADEDVSRLTESMVSSGRVYDYRASPELEGKKLVRRYPTGALSEKVALLLPALLAARSRRHRVVSPFLVARSLSFTGGTWDKLLAIPGFRFPAPGREVVSILARYGAAMVVTSDDCCPADRIMYRFRSLTGTVRSRSLIAASIGGKQLAVPVHRLLLDVRYGSGSFFPSRAAAQDTAEMIRKLTGDEMEVEIAFTEASYPGGSSIGNLVEVAEAVCILNPSAPGSDIWDARGLDFQRRVLRRMYDGVVRPQGSPSLFAEVDDLIASGEAIKSFAELLVSHGVDPVLVRQVCEDPLLALGLRAARWQEVVADRSGVIRTADQVRLGQLVNFAPSPSNMILHVRPGDRVVPGQKLATLIVKDHAVALSAASVHECFMVA